MSFKIIQNTGSGAPLGTVIEGVDLENLDDEMFAKIEDAFNKNYVIVFMTKICRRMPRLI